MRKPNPALKAIDENVAAAVAALRGLADRIERGDARLHTISLGVEPEYETIRFNPISEPPGVRRQYVASYARTLSLTYSERTPPTVEYRLEDFTQG
jgi:hypothetical protein